MKALFWKEIREIGKWALLAAVGITAAMLYALGAASDNHSLNDPWQTLCSQSFLLISTFGFPVVALALGFLQVLTEQRRDQWAFLVHRPVTRNTIFWGKALSGTLLYLFAVLVPLFGVAWWVSLPGSVAAPFDWRLVYPALWDAIVALAFYFAALQSGVMSGPWFGRRLLPLIAACAGTISVNDLRYFHEAATSTLTILMLSALSAWAIFLSNGSFRNASVWGKSAIAMFGLFGLTVLSGWWNSGYQLVFQDTPSEFEDYCITKDGQFVIATKQEEKGITKVITPDNVELHHENKGFAYEDFLNEIARLSFARAPMGDDWRSARRYFELAHENGGSFVQWYWLPKANLFCAYGNSSKRVEQWLGPQGVTADQPKAGFYLQNDDQGFWRPILVSKNEAWRPNFDRNEVQKLCSFSDSEKLQNVRLLDESNRRDEWLREFALATDRNIQLRAKDGSLIISTPQIPELRNYWTVQLFRKPDLSRYFLLFAPKYWLNPIPPFIFLELSATGEVLKRIEVPYPEHLRNWSLGTAWDAASQPLGESLLSHSLIGLRRAMDFPMSEFPIWKYNAADLTYTLQCWAISLLVGVVCAGAGQILFKRLGIHGPERWAWTAFFVFFSFAGLLMLAIVHEWPRRKRCAGCGLLRSIERPTCGQCGGTWQPQKRDGTEVFGAILRKPTTPISHLSASRVADWKGTR